MEGRPARRGAAKQPMKDRRRSVASRGAVGHLFSSGLAKFHLPTAPSASGDRRVVRRHSPGCRGVDSGWRDDAPLACRRRGCTRHARGWRGRSVSRAGVASASRVGVISRDNRSVGSGGVVRDCQRIRQRCRFRRSKTPAAVWRRGPSRRGQPSIDRLQSRWPTLRLIHLYHLGNTRMFSWDVRLGSDYSLTFFSQIGGQPVSLNHVVRQRNSLPIRAIMSDSRELHCTTAYYTP